MADGKKMRSEASTSGSAGNSGRGESVVVDIGRRKSTCGYCKSGARTSITHGLWAHSLTVDDYQALLDRGWRRSGCLLYKPEMDKTCCPSYTIRLKASNFLPSKEQIRVSKRMQRFLDGKLEVKSSAELIGETEASKGSCCSVNISDKSSDAMDLMEVDSEGKEKTHQFIDSLSNEIDRAVELCIESGELSSDFHFPKASVKRVSPSKRKLQADILEDLIFSCNIAFQIAATLRRTRKDVVVVKSSEHGLGVNRDSSELSPKTIAEILVSHLKQLTESFGLSVRACNGHINFYSATGQVCFDEEIGSGSKLKTPYTADKGSNGHSKKSCGAPQCQRLRFEIRLKRSSFDDEEYSLYKKYQLRVHNDSPAHVTESSYRRFLVDTPLVHVSPTGDGAAPWCGFGSFHQQYVLDGKLIAVGVIDILPNCLSSKYLFWDPDLAFLSLGKYSALEEIRWINENQMHCPSLQYYYLGYYIHSCSKMRYKASYRPSELLCPLRYQWVPYDVVKPLLDRRKYVCLSDFPALQNEHSLLPTVFDDTMEEQLNHFVQDASGDAFVNEDEMAESDSEDSEDESDSEATGATSVESEDADLSDLLIGLRGVRLRYENIRHAFDSSRRKLLDVQLQRYVRVVGTELSKQMVYSLV
ncbi:arginyl-tRNA--protein transferase 1 [Dorcoceras hygrometricum]|uniref:Arginyl-tRNA--protein transferase n=1 Tax=Dorcoceras hygrometricum TaxID=472368 RepID=A0A2Z7AWX4_9LAMI|nr:arginyl-tRNA--protein transferase 1 [Dorcoceras hygrometricum]